MLINYNMFYLAVKKPLQSCVSSGLTTGILRKMIMNMKQRKIKIEPTKS